MPGLTVSNNVLLPLRTSEVFVTPSDGRLSLIPTKVVLWIMILMWAAGKKKKKKPLHFRAWSLNPLKVRSGSIFLYVRRTPNYVATQPKKAAGKHHLARHLRDPTLTFLVVCLHHRPAAIRRRISRFQNAIRNPVSSNHSIFFRGSPQLTSSYNPESLIFQQGD